MVNSNLFQILVAALLGTLAGLGVGGGSLLMLWLTSAAGVAYPEARTINLLFFLPCALISTLFRWRQGSISPKNLLPAIAAGAGCAILGAWLSGQLHLQLLKKLFGGLLILTGIRELLYKPKRKREGK